MSPAVPRRLLPIAALATLLLLLLQAVPAAAGPVRAPVSDTTVVVSPTTPSWGFAQETATGSGSFVAGPGTVPAGNGSAQLTVNGTGGVLLATADYRATFLNDVNELRYFSYRQSGGALVTPTLQFSIDYDLTDTNTNWQGRLVYEPYHSGTTPSTGVWQEWDALAPNARWFATGAPGNTICTQASPCTTAVILATWPNAGVRDAIDGVMGFKAGGGWSGGFTGNVDKFIIDVAGERVTYDFEQCAPGTVVNVDTTESFCTIQAAINDSDTLNGHTILIAAGTYAEKVSVTKSLTLTGAGASTIIDGTGLGNASGIAVSSGLTAVTIQDLRVQNQTVNANGAAIHFAGGNNGLTVEDVEIATVSGGQGGLYISGHNGIDDVLVNRMTISGVTNGVPSRGIVIWGGFKTNITITNNTLTGVNCCGIELQDGTASGVTITGNNVTVNNGDSAIGAVGLMAGAGPNLIANNIIATRGRFGIELKLPNGTGAASGDGSIVVEQNTVTFAGTLVDARDLAGISVYRRGYVAGNNNVDIPTGVVVRDNTVSGFQQPSTSDGFGIVVEGTNMTVTGNTVTDNDVGIQLQAGHGPYIPNTAQDGDQNNLADQYFGRGNSPIGCAAISGNTFSANGANERRVGPVGGGIVTNTNTSETFCTIQAAINDSDTLNGHTILIAAGTYAEKVAVTKSLTLTGAGNTTIIDGTALGNASGIAVSSGLTNVTIQDLRVQNQMLNANDAAIHFAGANNGLTVEDVEIVNTSGGQGALYISGINGGVDNVLVNRVTVNGAINGVPARGIVIWNGYKSNITITNNTLTGVNCCGIELQDGTASGVTITDNTVSVNNGDSAIGVIGLMAGAGPNVIADNTITTRGRFGIEIKLPNGTGATSGDGSIVVEDNTVTFAGTLIDQRDLAGISVYRRGYQAANNNVDIPTGVVVRNNTVSGFKQPSTSDGFGIVVEGTNMAVYGNTVSDNDVGIQLQAGHLPYTPNTNVDGDQSNLDDDYFGRGNSPVGCAAISANTFSGNGVDERRVGPVGGGTVTNLNTPESFCSIQAAHDDSDTANGDTLQVGAGTYEEQVEITKAITLDGAGEGVTIIKSPVTLTKSFTTSEVNKPIVWVHDQDGVTIRDLTVDGDGRGNANYRFVGIAYQNAGGTIDDVTITGVRDTPLSNAQHGTGIYAIVTNATARALSVSESTVADFQKNGLTLVGGGLTATVTSNIVTGSGPLGLGFAAQNGIQLSDGALGTITGNTVSDLNYFNPDPNNDYLAIAVLVYDAATGTVVNGNTVEDSRAGVYFYQTDGTMNGNTVTNVAANMGSTPYWWGIIADAGATALGLAPDAARQPMLSLVDEGGTAAPSLVQAATVTVSNNTLAMGGKGTGIEGDAYTGQPLTLSIVGNSVSASTVAISLYEAGSSALSATVSGNTLTNTGQVGTGIEVTPGAEAIIGSDAPLPLDPAVSNDVSGFEDGILIAGAATVRGNYGSISGNAVGIHVLNGGTATIERNDILSNDVGLRYESGAISAALSCNNIAGSPQNIGLNNLTGASFDATLNYWDSPAGPTGPGADGITGTPVQYIPWKVAPMSATTGSTCEDVLAVVLADFTATSNATGDAVTVKWETVSEFDILGFNLYRREAGQPEVLVNSELVPAVGGSQGAMYSLLDEEVVSGTTYTYALDVLNMDGSTERLGEVSVTPGTPTAVMLSSAGAAPAPIAPLAAVAGLALLGLVALARRRP